MGGLFAEVMTLEVPAGRGAPDVVALGRQPR
jgi:hypothetical protein